MAKNRYTKRTTICGKPTGWRKFIITKTPWLDKWDCKHVRARKQQASTEARKLQNRKRASRKLESLLFANFSGDNLVITLTYALGQEPHTEKDVKKNIRYFWRKLREAMEKQSLDKLRYIYVTENLHGQGEVKGRVHFHGICNLLWRDRAHRELVESCWPYGMVRCEAVRTDAAGCPEFGAVANYWCKERRDDVRKVGSRAWVSSKHLLKPATTKEAVDGFEVLEAPADAIIEEHQRSELGYGVGWEVLIYYLPPVPAAPSLTRSRRTSPRQNSVQTFSQ